MRLLLIEDNDPLRLSLRQALESAGYVVDVAADGVLGWEQASESCHEVIILDRMLPGLDGLEVLRRLRRSGSTVPVLLLTALDTVEERVAGIDAGADDYLTKPFAVAELLARLRMLLRRGGHRSDPVITIGEVELDTVARRVSRAGRRIAVTPKEYALLEYLAARPETLVTRPELMEQLYGTIDEGSGNALEALVTRIRRKLQVPGQEPVLHTRRGFGYQLGGSP